MRACAQRVGQRVLPKSSLRKGLCAKSLPKSFAKEFFFEKVLVRKGLPESLANEFLEKGFVRERFAKKFYQRVS